MVFGYLTGSKYKERFIILSTCKRFGVKQKAAWSLMMKTRAEMSKNSSVLEEIVEADETDIGGRGNKDYDREEDEPVNAGVAL